MRTFQTAEVEPTSRTAVHHRGRRPRPRPPACEIAPELLAEELQALAGSCRRQLERCVQSPDAGRLRRRHGAAGHDRGRSSARRRARAASRRGGRRGLGAAHAGAVRADLLGPPRRCSGCSTTRGLRDVAATCRTLADLVGGWQPPVTPVPSASRAPPADGSSRRGAPARPTTQRSWAHGAEPSHADRHAQLVMPPRPTSPRAWQPRSRPCDAGRAGSADTRCRRAA